jgi:hypothetical protein
MGGRGVFVCAADLVHHSKCMLGAAPARSNKPVSEFEAESGVSPQLFHTLWCLSQFPDLSLEQWPYHVTISRPDGVCTINTSYMNNAVFFAYAYITLSPCHLLLRRLWQSNGVSSFKKSRVHYL